MIAVLASRRDEGHKCPLIGFIRSTPAASLANLTAIIEFTDNEGRSRFGDGTSASAAGHIDYDFKVRLGFWSVDREIVDFRANCSLTSYRRSRSISIPIDCSDRRGRALRTTCTSVGRTGAFITAGSWYLPWRISSARQRR